jgi:hypothetical protein
MPKLYEQVISRMREDLKSVQYLSITTDLWSADCASMNILALTGHFISNDLQIGHLILGAVPIKGLKFSKLIFSFYNIYIYTEKHKTTGVVEGHIRNILIELDVPLSKIHMVISDHGSNVRNAVAELGLDWFGCMAHKLNLALKVS